MLLAVKAASMVESHSDDYVVYLCHVFHDDPEFQKDVERWGREELQHGSALRRWAEIADPNWDFASAFARFKKGHVLPLDATESIRGSRTSELVARCVIEVGTSSFYSALRDAVDEPVLKQICGNIAADEFRHYKLFYKNSKHYRGLEKSSLLARLWVALSRLWRATTTNWPTHSIAVRVTIDPMIVRPITAPMPGAPTATTGSATLRMRSTWC